MAAFVSSVLCGISLALALGLTPAPDSQQLAAPDGPTTLLRRLQQAATAGDRAAVLALGHPQISRPSFEDFANSLTSIPPTRLVVTERDRAQLDAGALRLVVEIFSERGMEGALGTWRMDVRPGAAPADAWTIAAVSRLSVVTGLYRLSLNTATEYDIHNLVVRAPDLSIDLPVGRGFLAATPDGPTAMVLLGRGRMQFSPPDPAERTQIRIFSGRDELVEETDVVFLRFSPYQFETLFDKNAIKKRSAVDPSDVRSATTIFNDLVPRSLQIDLSDISRDRWSLTPSFGDIIAELRTRRFGTLTYARSSGEAEDINVFDRKRRRNISVYTSAEKLAERGRFYSEDDRLDYDVLAYDLDVQFNPDRVWIDGDARMKLKIRSAATSSLTMKLAESVSIQGVYSPDFGRLLHLRVVGQNSLIVNLPEVLTHGTEFWLDVRYSGPVAPQTFDREAIQIGQGQAQEVPEIRLQPLYLYSNRSYWYPQSTATDYATASIRISVPNDFDAIATGEPVGSPTSQAGSGDGRRRRTFVFEASRPARYLAMIVSRFNRVDSTRINAGGSDVSLYLQATPRASVRLRDISERAGAVFSFYASLAGDAPYPSFTLALAESDRPGGHSPPYFAVLNQVVPGSNFVWRNDPVSFENYPAFFLAHELAHQWWGQAVGWKNYHEQWISEGFAQYFAALYAEREGGVMPNLLRQMRRTAIDASSNGPVYLGYRLGHIQGDDRIFRAIVYNKGAMVLHMLRRLVGDEMFFAGIRSFYQEWKFKKAGTDDFRKVMEKVSGRDLQRFFDTWVYGFAVPHVKFSYHVSGDEATVRFDQHAEPVDVPVTVTVTYASGVSENILVILADKNTDRTIPLKGPVRTIAANTDNAALVEIDR